MTSTTYTAPVLRVHGSLEAITKGNATGSYFDANYVSGQPVPNPLNIFS